MSQAQRRALISEAVRGEGAHLVHRDGRRFMRAYDERRRAGAGATS